jgi:SpoVK/Ycf46/Vps4 family AAA+-type ATPase
MPVNKKMMLDVAILVAMQVGLFFAVKKLITIMDPNHDKKEKAKLKSQSVLNRLGKDLELSEHEQIIASEIIWPEDLKITFQDIGGLETMIDDLTESVIYPLIYPELFKGLLGPPKGVLLYGPPGCGKTMLAKALAKESGATFINLHVSTMTDKWFGESQKLVHGLFSLARKLAPTLIFIDEIDSFLRERKSSDHEATSMMKAEFMTLWDGMNTGESRVVILGATNRPSDIDRAILRRMPKRFQVGLPDLEQREKVLRLVSLINKILQKIKLEDDFKFQDLAKYTDGYSNSDLKELCRNAVMVPVRESIRKVSKANMPKSELKVFFY